MKLFLKNTPSIVFGYGSRLVLMSSLAILMLLMPLSAADDGEAFRVISANFSLNESLLELNAEIAIELPSYIKTAIEQGFAVPLMFQVEILSARKYWLDEKIIALKQQFLLHFLPMLSSYVIFDLNAGQRYYFDSLSEAVHYLHVVYNYPMLNINNISEDREVYARIRVGLDSDELPIPLKSSSLWDNDWGLKSDWYAWNIEKSSYE
jgi:hypothetical protein